MSDFSTPAGWYPDGDGWERRWDGESWTEERRRMAEPTQVRPSEPPSGPAPSGPPTAAPPNSGPPTSGPPTSAPPSGPPTAAPPNWAPQGSGSHAGSQASYGHVPSVGLGSGAGSGWSGSQPPSGPPTPPLGTPIGAPQGFGGFPPSGPPRKSRLWLWLTLGLVGALVVASAIVLVVVAPWKDDDGEGKDDDKAAAPAIHGDIDGDGFGDVVYRFSLDYDNVKLVTGISDGEGAFETTEIAVDNDPDFGDLHFDWDSDGVSEQINWKFIEGGSQLTLTSTDKDFPGAQNYTLKLSTLAEYGGDDVLVIPGDYDGDGNIDIAVMNQNDRVVDASVLINDGEGTFADPVLWLAIPNATIDEVELRAGDFDGDGDDDLWANLPSEKLDDKAYTRYYSGRKGFTMLTSTGDAFEQGALSESRVYEDFFLVGDVTGDGTISLVGVQGSSYEEQIEVTVYDVSDGTMSPVAGFTGTSDIGDRRVLNATLSDVDGDGTADVVFAAKAYDEQEITGIQVMKSTGAVFDEATVWAETPGCLERSCRIQFEGQPRY